MGTKLPRRYRPSFWALSFFHNLGFVNRRFGGIRQRLLFSASGAGISSAQFAVDHDVQIVITGELGAHAQQVLQSAGIAVQMPNGGIVSEDLKRLREGGNT